MKLSVIQVALQLILPSGPTLVKPEASSKAPKRPWGQVWKEFSSSESAESKRATTSVGGLELDNRRICWVHCCSLLPDLPLLHSEALYSVSDFILSNFASKNLQNIHDLHDLQPRFYYYRPTTTEQLQTDLLCPCPGPRLGLLGYCWGIGAVRQVKVLISVHLER